MIPNNWQKKIYNNEPVILMGVYDALTSILASNNGFDGLWWSSFGISMSSGVPDESIITHTDIIHRCLNTMHNVTIPSIVDCDAGYGGIQQLMHATSLFNQIGVAGISVEDYKHPKVCSLMKNIKRNLCTTNEMCLRIKTIKERFKNDIILFARTESLVVNKSVDKALIRANQYFKSGADAIIVHNTEKTADILFEFSSRWHEECPLVAIPTTYGSVDESTLFSNGYKIIIYANVLIRSSANAMIESLNKIKIDKRLNDIDKKILNPLELISIIKSIEKIKE